MIAEPSGNGMEETQHLAIKLGNSRIIKQFMS